MGDGGDASRIQADSATADRGARGDAMARERIISEALRELRLVAAELRADALESRSAHLDPARVLDASRRVERLAAEILRAVGLAPVEGPLLRTSTRAPPVRPRVLVVDDDPELRAMATMILEPGYEVLSAADGEASLAIARAERPISSMKAPIASARRNGAPGTRR